MTKNEAIIYLKAKTLKNTKLAEACEFAIKYLDNDNLVSIDNKDFGFWEKAENDGCVSYSNAFKQCSVYKEKVFFAEKYIYCPYCGRRMKMRKYNSDY